MFFHVFKLPAMSVYLDWGYISFWEIYTKNPPPFYTKPLPPISRFLPQITPYYLTLFDFCGP